MLPAQNMIDDCDFNNASDIPTIVNFMITLEKATDCVDVDTVKILLIGMFWACHLVGLREYPSSESVKIAWGVTS